MNNDQKIFLISLFNPPIQDLTISKKNPRINNPPSSEIFIQNCPIIKPPSEIG